MEEIIRFVTLVQTDRFTLTELCKQFGISRKTAYKHLERYAAEFGLSAIAIGFRATLRPARRRRRR